MDRLLKRFTDATKDVTTTESGKKGFARPSTKKKVSSPKEATAAQSSTSGHARPQSGNRPTSAAPDPESEDEEPEQRRQVPRPNTGPHIPHMPHIPHPRFAHRAPEQDEASESSSSDETDITGPQHRQGTLRPHANVPFPTLEKYFTYLNVLAEELDRRGLHLTQMATGEVSLAFEKMTAGARILRGELIPIEKTPYSDEKKELIEEAKRAAVERIGPEGVFRKPGPFLEHLHASTKQDIIDRVVKTEDTPERREIVAFYKKGLEVLTQPRIVSVCYVMSGLTNLAQQRDGPRESRVYTWNYAVSFLYKYLQEQRREANRPLADAKANIANVRNRCQSWGLIFSGVLYNSLNERFLARYGETAFETRKR